MNQTHSQNTISISSKEVEDHLDATIIQLANVLKVERTCDSDESIKEISLEAVLNSSDSGLI